MVHRVSRETKQLRGTYRKDRDRQRAPDVGTIGPPPKSFEKHLAPIWKELVASLPKEFGVPSDRLSFELLVRLTYKMREQIDEMRSGDITQLRLLMETFALSPSGRQRLAVPAPPKPREKDDLDEFVD